MNAAQHHLTEAVRILASLDLEDLTKRIRNAVPGINAQQFDGPQVSSGQGPSDPTGSQALRRPDPSVRHAAQVNDHASKLHALALTLAKLDATYTAPAHGSRDRLTAANEPTCHYCDQYHHEDGKRCGPIYGVSPTTIGERVEIPRWTGRGHYDLIRFTYDTAARLPTDREYDEYARTGRRPRLRESIT